MIKEAIEKIAAMQAALAAVSVLDSSPRGKLLNINGQLEYRPSDQDLRSHQVDTVADLIEASKRFGAVDVWVNSESVVAVLNDPHGLRLDRITLPLIPAPVFLRLIELGGKVLGQQQLVELLRFELPSVVGREAIVGPLKSLRFKSSVEGHSDIQHGRESMGKSIDNAVTGAADIPEEAIVNTPVFQNPGEHDSFDVRCYLTVNAAEQKFKFRPFAGEIELARNAAMDGIVDRIRDGMGETPVFYGKP